MHKVINNSKTTYSFEFLFYVIPKYPPTNKSQEFVNMAFKCIIYI